MQNWNKFPRFILALTLLIGLCAGLFAPKVEKVEARPMRANALDVAINEVAWSGTVADVNDEWIELYNPTGTDIDLTGWALRATDGTPDIALSGMIFAGDYFLLERTDDNAISDIPADMFFTGALGDGGEILTLYDDLNNPIDTANGNGGGWPAGSGAPNRFSMERNSISTESDASWTSNDGIIRNGLDIGSNPINGTPKQQNSALGFYTPLTLLINEVAWAGTVASIDDEWIELYNPSSTTTIDFDATPGWRLLADDGSPDILLSGTIAPDSYFLLERISEQVTNIPADQFFSGTLEDTNEILRLRAPNGTIVDTANSDGGAWPAGTVSPPRSMERMGVITDVPLSWVSFDNNVFTAQDAAGNNIYGTPGNSNWGFTVTHTLTPTITPTLTPTLTLTPTITLTSAITRSVIINEVAWAGTNSSLTDDEWIELYNPGTTAVNITGWNLKSSDGTPDITLSGSVPAGGYFLLERDDDFTVSDIIADQIYTGNALSNSGEALTLYDGSNKVIDTANGNGGAWPKGSSSTYGTMERIGNSAESDNAWLTNTGIKKNGKNANGGDILGTPKSSNSPAPTPTPTPNKTDTPVPPATYRPPDPRPIINEILPRPGFDWNQDDKVNVFDEFIEIKNLTSIDISLNGWKLDKVSGGSFPLPNVTLKPGERIVFYSLETNLLLSDGGETVRLINASGKIYDAYTYTIAKVEDRSICRLPDGNVFNGWYNDCIPTPNLSNTREGVVPSMPGEGFESPVCQLPDTLPADFLFAECHGYGANIWDAYYWDQLGMQGSWYIPQNTSKWEAIIE